MNKKSIKKTTLSFVLFVSSIILGYALISLPFHLFSFLSSKQMLFIFIAETVIYLLIGSSFLLVRESKKEKAKRHEKMIKRHNQRVNDYENEIKSLKIKADIINFAA